MNDQRDPQIMALIVELAESARSAPSYDELDEIFERSGDDVEVDYVPEADHSRAPEHPATPRRKNRRIALAAAAAILVVAAGVAVVDRGNESVVTDSVSQPSVVEPAAPSGVTEPVPPVWPLVFQDQAGLEGDMRSAIEGVLAGGPGFVAVGSHDDNAAAWTSVDGLTWSRVPHDEAVFGGEGGQAMVDVTVGGPGLVAVGGQNVCTDREVAGREDPATTCEDGNAAVWTSVDGLTWSRVPHDEAVFGGQDSHAMRSVTAGGPGLVAVGSSGPLEVEDRKVGDDDAAVWTSADGLTWTRVTHDEAVFGGVENQAMSDVTVGGPGLVAVGRDGGGPAWDNPVSPPGQDAAVWTSVDGLTWTRVAHDETVFGGEGGQSPAMVSVTAGGPGLVAVGYSFPSSVRAAVWTSVDGLTWSLVTHANEAEMSGTMADVTVGGPGLLAVGSGSNGAAVWTSPDGLTWSLAANGDIEPGHYASWMSALTSANGRMVAVGSVSPDPDSLAAAAWTSPNP